MLTVRTLAREIAAAEHGLPTTHATGESYRNVYNALSQTHLPTLADAGIVIYDSERQIVSEGPNLSLAVLLVELVGLLSRRFKTKNQPMETSRSNPVQSPIE